MLAMLVISTNESFATAKILPNSTCITSTAPPLSEIISTPADSEIRYVPMKLASSFSCVSRVMVPAASAIRSPAISPPIVIGHNETPATKKAIAAPGKIACVIASPISVMRRSTINTPSGAPPTASAMLATSARRMKP